MRLELINLYSYVRCARSLKFLTGHCNCLPCAGACIYHGSSMLAINYNIIKGHAVKQATNVAGRKIQDTTCPRDANYLT